MKDDALLELAGRYRESLRHAVYLIRSLDAEGELSTAQVSTLNMVAEGPARVSDIARNSGIRVPSATEQIIRLEAARLVTRGPDAHDARVVLVSLTPKGREVLAGANNRRNKMLAAQLATLSAADREAITAAIPALNRLSIALGRPPYR
ncbi:winged helix DNA-binding protein [Paenarthrobacter sp. Z7-10]|uniref:MarR family winged helix-turn-helix transcriptional regulator n=1 Tax=Paenarthrobacter sp. Z7-10 TaxID=2787635 RepID=UPI0022A91CD9|nr:MarR family transcriptional regulator [Paenarthrobacter sp. Z7-10]MCZ2402163.1 winged helix DNA-binding protein [Paenarthrobacter sp. Z7-10]